ncbi:ATP-dependent 6-phosphofructokinase [Desulfatiferula olefinivorans]
MEFEHVDTGIESLGDAKIDSPFMRDEHSLDHSSFVDDSMRVLLDVNEKNLYRMLEGGRKPPAFEIAGPRKKIYFDSSKLRCALVTCGGLCPGLNDIIRAVVLELVHRYGVKHIYGIKYGLQGFIPEYGHDLVDLSPESVVRILERGGSILGSSRGPQDVDAIVDSLERMNIGIVFMIGGDGTMMAATRIHETIRRRNLKISVIGIPKTIDNDIYLVARSFGFDTAVEIATQAIRGAHNEAEGYPYGIGLIKLMGRHSGFLAATAALAQQDVNFVLIPEVDFDLDGDKGLLACLERRLKERKHAVILVAEGAGQKFFGEERTEHDPSGNVKLKDIGLYLKDRIIDYFKEKELPIALKYIDPSYIIRSLPANANDHVFCSFLGRDAVHAGMAGKTNMLIGHWNNHFVHVPMKSSAGRRKQVSPQGKLWVSVLEATGQSSLTNAATKVR